MTCLKGRSRHLWVRGDIAQRLHIGCIEQSDDMCVKCGKTRAQVKMEKETKKK